MESIHLFNGEIRNPDASNYGAFYWGVVLEDGRSIYIHADRMVVTDTGDLIAISTSRSKDGVRTDRNPQPMLALAKGHWVSYFAASVLDGEPVALDNSVEFPSK
jgi:hypothetical protein